MILKRLFGLLTLVKKLEAAVPSLYDLDKDVGQLSIKDDESVSIMQASESFLTRKVAIKHEDALFADTLEDTLFADTLEDDIKTVVENIDRKLFDLLNSGVSPSDTALIIKSYSFTAEELVAVARGIQAHNLLKVLQAIYIWHDDTQFHNFQALSYSSPWYDEALWNTHEMDWNKHLRAVFELNNVALAIAIAKDSPPGAALEILGNNLLELCIEYDAIEIFKATRMDLVQSEKQLELMYNKSSIRLLKFYQITKGLEDLQLERFSLPEKLPDDVDGFIYLMNHGCSYLPMSQFITKFCKENRLDLLKYLYALESELVPTEKDLELVAEKGQMDILEWAHQIGMFKGHSDTTGFSSRLALCLAINSHFQALSWLIRLENVSVDVSFIESLAEAGALEALQWIDKEQLIKQNTLFQGNVTGTYRFPILKWLHEKFRFLPKHYNLRDATAEMLDWVQSKGIDLDHRTLAFCGLGNLEILQWIYKNGSALILQENKWSVENQVPNMETMLWVHENMGFCSFNMYWAYKAGNLEAIKWAKEKCHVFPTLENISSAIRNENSNVFEWIIEHFPEFIETNRLLFFKSAFESGNLKAVRYLGVNSLKEKIRMKIDDRVPVNRRLDILQWLVERKQNIDIDLLSEITRASQEGYLKTLEWFVKTWPRIRLPKKVWTKSSHYGQFNVYKWLLEKYPEKRKMKGFCHDLCLALSGGHLEIVRAIISKHPSIYKDPSLYEAYKSRINATNYHIKHWSIANNKWPNY